MHEARGDGAAVHEAPGAGTAIHEAPSRPSHTPVTKEQVDAASRRAKEASDAAAKLSLRAGGVKGSLDQRFERIKEQVEAEIGGWKESWQERIRGAQAKGREAFLEEWKLVLEQLDGVLRRQAEAGEQTIRGLEEQAKRRGQLEAQKKKAAQDLENCRERRQEAGKARLRAETRRTELERQIAELKKRLPHGERAAAEAELTEHRRRLLAMEQALNAAEKRLNEYSGRVSAAEARAQALNRQLEAFYRQQEERCVICAATQGSLSPMQDSSPETQLSPSDWVRQLEAELAGTGEILERLEAGRNRLHHRLETNRLARDNMVRQQAAMEAARQQWTWVKAMADTAAGEVNGKDKITFETYVQMAYFERIIARANARFMVMSGGQYELKRCMEEDGRGKNGLGLSVIDHYNGSERSARTLSGGESFQASLSLALGLSDEIQSQAGGIRLDTMFVDEGFGSLDGESLNLAVKALAGLAEGNRLVGIISHVPELKERIEKQIVVTKEKSGGSRAEIDI